MADQPASPPAKGDDLPITSVSWEEAHRFIDRLNQRVKRRIYRLPTEAEWEYAARAGSATRFSFGDDPAELFHYGNCKSGQQGDGYDGLAPVGSFKPNRWGLYDMYGNAWEWVEDWYGAYGAAPEVDPQGPAEDKQRVRRGGSYEIKAENCRSSIRKGTSPNSSFRTYGLRLAQDLP